MRSLRLALCGLLLVGCKSEPDPSAARLPPPDAAKPEANACALVPKPRSAENVVALPPKAGPFCVDPKGSDRSFGEGAEAPLKPGICDLFDGECEIYVEHGVKRVTEARYVDGAGSAATVDVKLSRFGSPEQALAMFTKRAVGGGDPGHPSTPKPVNVAGLAALGLGNAYLWRGNEVAEVTMNDASLSMEKLRQRADAVLPELVRGMSERLGGTTELPASAKLLPKEGRLPSGLRIVLTDALVKGAGSGAFGFYGEGEKRWRVLAVAANDETEAKRALEVMRAGGSSVAGLGDDAARVALGPQNAEWLLARRGATLMGVGDEALVLRTAAPEDERAKLSLSTEEKRTRLEALLKAR